MASTDRSASHDNVLDATQTEDSAYLEKLGYKQELNRALGLFSSFGVQFTSIAIASGIFTTLIVGFGFFGPASFWSFVVGGTLQVVFVGTAVAQLVSAYPLAGGVYQIVGRITRRPWLAWQTGWWLVIAHTVAVTAVSVSIAPYVATYFGVSDPNITLWAIGIIVVVTVFNLAGVRIAALLNNVGVIAEIVCIALILGALIFVPHPTQDASILFNDGGAVANGAWLAPFFFAMILPAYAISSFDATGNASEETKDAARKAPLATTLANGIALVVGILLVGLIIFAIRDVPAVMESGTPVRDVLVGVAGNTFTNIFEIIAILALLATIAMLQLTGVRVVWSQARDGQLPAAAFMRKVGRNRIPINATLVLMVLSILFAIWSALLSVLAAMTALAWALAYGVVVVAGLWALIKKRLPAHPFNLKAFAIPIFIVAAVWSVVLVVLLVMSDPLLVGLGMLGVIVAGAIIHRLIPKSRRGALPPDPVLAVLPGNPDVHDRTP